MDLRKVDSTMLFKGVLYAELFSDFLTTPHCGPGRQPGFTLCHLIKTFITSLVLMYMVH